MLANHAARISIFSAQNPNADRSLRRTDVIRIDTHTPLNPRCPI
jgi:hypothetical protein